MILAPKSFRWKRLWLAFGLLFLSIPALGESDNHSSFRGASSLVDEKDDPTSDGETPRHLTGDGGKVTIDFDDLDPGEYVSNQYASYGLKLRSSGGHGYKPRIFDTSNPVTGDYGDIDLGSPNDHCHPSGPGRGPGGAKGAPGENCVPLRNVLIIQEKNDNMDIPDDNANGGKIIFDFDPPASIVYQMGFLDNDYGGKVRVKHGAGVQTSFDLPTLGDNAYEEIDINLTKVTQVVLEVARSGAVVFISFQPGPDEPDVPDCHVPERIEIPYDIISILDIETCFDPVAWCESELFDILVDALEDEDFTPEEFDVMLNGLQAFFCDGVTSALAGAIAVIRGSGVFALIRGGYCDSVNQISLDVNLDTATVALASVDASASAEANARAYAFARTGVCSRYASNTLRYRLCALAKGQAYASTVATAEATGSATGVAGTDQSTDVSIYVDAHKILEFIALINTSASSFAGADAEATAKAFAIAYADAFAKVSTSAVIKQYYCCRHKKRMCDEICRWGWCKCRWHWTCMGICGWWSTVFAEKFTLIVERVGFDVERSYAEAYAGALANISVKVNIPAYFKDLHGQDDIIMFNDGDLDVAIDVSTQCIATS